MSQPLEDQDDHSYLIDCKEKTIIISNQVCESLIRITWESLIPGKWNYERMREVIHDPRISSPWMFDMWKTVSIARDELIDRGLIPDE